MITTGGIYKKNLIDLFEFTIDILLVSYIFFIVYRENSQEAFKILFRELVKLVRVSVFIVSIIYLLYSGFKILVQNIVEFELNTYKLISIDKIFFFIGIACYLPDLIGKKLGTKDVLYLQSKLAVIGLSIILSGELKSWILLGALFIIAFLSWVFSALKYNNTHFVNKKTSLLSILIWGLAFIVSIYLLPENTMQLLLSNNFYSNLMTELHFHKWIYSFQLFSEYNFMEKLFGDGFDYLKQFKFHFEHKVFDYPHNPILSSLLYSGLVGAVFTIIFLLLTFYYSLKYSKEYPAFSIMLLLSLFFSMFSGNSIFSIPFFLFLFTVSFLIRHIETSDFIIHFNLKNRNGQILKELFDFILSTTLFIFLLPILVSIGIAIRIWMGSPILFAQNRVGRNGKLFKLYKFRTMTIAKKHLTGVAAAETARITRLGRFLRKTKLDELPELMNIIKGDMSFVGPRPDVPGYADNLKGNDRLILELKPGLTGPASLKYRNEEEILKLQPNPIQYNDEIIFPDKVRINLLYMENWNLLLDILLIIKTGTGGKFDENDYFKNSDTF